MARPIKETPILYGEDARRFVARMREKRRETPEQKASRMADYELILGMLKRGEELKRQHAMVSCHSTTRTSTSLRACYISTSMT